MADVKNGMSYLKASEKHKVPRSTLCDKVNGRVPLKPSLPGPSAYLTNHQETRLTNWLITMSKIGYAVVRKEIPDVVKGVLDEAEKDGYVIPEGRKFVDNRPSKCWIYSFFKRHPKLSARIPENLGYQRAIITEELLRDWFTSFERFLKDEHEIDATEFLQESNASRVFNIDESGFPLQGTNGKMKVVAETGCKNIHRLAPDTKEQITVLGCVSASGSYSKPMVILPGMRLPKFNFNGVNPDDFDVSFTPNR